MVYMYYTTIGQFIYLGKISVQLNGLLVFIEV